MRRLSTLLYRIAGFPSLLAITLVYVSFLIIVMPGQAAASREYAGAWGAPDRQLFYTPAEFYRQVGDWPPAGRAHYVRFRLGPDIAWAAVYTGWLAIATSLVLGRLWAPTDPRRLLNLPALLPGLLDLLENGLGILLVLNHSLRLDPLVWLAATVTAAKWGSLVAGHLLLMAALAALAWWRWARRRSEGT